MNDEPEMKAKDVPLEESSERDYMKVIEIELKKESEKTG